MQDVGLHDSDGQSRCDAEIPEEASEMAVLWLRLRRTVQRRGRVPDCSYRHASDSPIDRGLPSPTSVTSPTTLLTTNVAQEVRTQDERRSGDDADDEIGNEQELPTGSGELSDRGYRVGRRINMLVKDEGGRVETCAVGILSTHNKLELSRKLSVIDSQEGGNSADNVDRCCFESLDEDLFTMHDPEDLGVVSAELFRQVRLWIYCSTLRLKQEPVEDVSLVKFRGSIPTYHPWICQTSELDSRSSRDRHSDSISLLTPVAPITSTLSLLNVDKH